MNYPPYNAYPPFYPQSGVVYIPMPQRDDTKQKSALELIQDVESQIDGLKKLKNYLKDEDKKDDKDKKKKPETPKFTFLETLSLLMLGSIPVAMFQIYLLQKVATSLAH